MPTIEPVPLIELALAGDRQAFGKLVSQHAGMVTGVAYSVCGDFARSEDIGQDAFLEAWKSLSTLREPEKFSSWVCTIARRRAIDQIRRSNSKQVSSLHPDIPDTATLSPESQMSTAEDRALIWKMLERLPETYRETLVLFYRGEQSVAEVATALCENEAAIRQRLKRGRELLRSEVNEVVADTLRSTSPSSSFSTAVIAMLPATKMAVSAAGTIGASTGKTALASGTTATVGSAIFGSLIGIAGGAFGSWMSWRNAEYKSQQRFMVRSLIYYCVGLSIFMLLMPLLVRLKLNGTLSNQVYWPLYGILMTSAFLLNGVWIWWVITSYKRIGGEAREAGEPVRPEVASQLAAFRDRARHVGDDGAIRYEAFAWNAGAWWGTTLGGTCWMIPFPFILGWHGDWAAAVIVSFCAALAAVAGIVIWQQRSRIKALPALHTMVLILGILTTIILATVSTLASTPSKLALHWSPWVWGLLFLFPLMSLSFLMTQRQAEKELRERDQLEQS